jgi:hypothetical protein
VPCGYGKAPRGGYEECVATAVPLKGLRFRFMREPPNHAEATCIVEADINIEGCGHAVYSILLLGRPEMEMLWGVCATSCVFIAEGVGDV